MNLPTVLCTDGAISTGRDPRVPGGLEGISSIHVQLVSANFKCVSKFVSYLKFCPCFNARRRDLEIARWLALNQTVINHSRCFKTQETNAPSVPTMRDAVGGNCWSVTVLSMLKAPLFVMVLFPSMWRRSPWIIVKLLFTRMMVVVCLILNSKGFVASRKWRNLPFLIGDNWGQARGSQGFSGTLSTTLINWI